MNLSTGFKIFIFSLAMLLFFAFSREAKATWSKDLAVMIDAKVTKGELSSITLNWNPVSGAREYLIFRKLRTGNSFGNAIAVLKADATTYTDNNIQVGVQYEYQIWCINKLNISQQYDSTAAIGYIAAGIDVMPEEIHGKILVLVDSTMAAPLSAELTRFKDDLISEGWSPIMLNVSRAEKFDAQKVKATKQLIASNNSKFSPVKAIVLIGRVAVPYSGEINPDGHPDHLGAWPADMYYGGLNEAMWTDTKVNNDTSKVRAGNINIPGDGKFDQSMVTNQPTNEIIISIPVGRIDFYDMPLFSKSETELLRQYLNKDHDYRTGNMKCQMKGLVDDNFGGDLEPTFASSAWRNFASLVGKDNVQATDWFTTLATDSYLFSYGCGGGWFTSASGIGSTTDFSQKEVKSVFTFLFGSYFGDWDVQNNFLRAPLCTEPMALTCAWDGRPHWYLHNMGLGEYIGKSVVLTQNNYSIYLPDLAWINGNNSPYIWATGMLMVHTSLMGDPTLAMYMGDIEPVQNLSVIQPPGGKIELKWDTSKTTDIIGYNIYRTEKAGEGLESSLKKVNKEIVKGNSYIDANLFEGTLNYLIRPVKLEQTVTGTFYNMGRGVSKSILATGVEENNLLSFNIAITPNPARTTADINVVLPKPGLLNLAIYDLSGNLVSNLNSSELGAGSQSFAWNLNNMNNQRVAPGVYLVKLTFGGRTEAAKLVVLP